MMGTNIIFNLCKIIELQHAMNKKSTRNKIASQFVLHHSYGDNMFVMLQISHCMTAHYMTNLGYHIKAL